MTDKKNNELDVMLDNIDKKQIKKLKSSRALYKIQRMLIKDFCVNCRALAFQDSKRPYSDYCNDCQAIATKVLGGILK